MRSNEITHLPARARGIYVAASAASPRPVSAGFISMDAGAVDLKNFRRVRDERLWL